MCKRLRDGKFQSLILVTVVETIPDIVVIVVLLSIIGNDGRGMLVGITTVIRTTTGRGFVVVVPTTALLHHHCDNDTK